MTMTVHALVGAALGAGLERAGGAKAGRMFLIAAFSAFGHVLLDLVPHGHPAPLLDLFGLGLVLAMVLRLTKSRSVLGGLAAAVLPDAFHLLPVNFDPFHGFLAAWGSAHPRALIQVAMGWIAVVVLLSLQKREKSTPVPLSNQIRPQHAREQSSGC